MLVWSLLIYYKICPVFPLLYAVVYVQRARHTRLPRVLFTVLATRQGYRFPAGDTVCLFAVLS